MKLFVFALLISGFLSMTQKPKDEINIGRKFSYRDSVLILHCIRTYHDSDLWTFRNYQKFYQIKNSEVKYHVDRIIYSPDKLKMMGWVVEEMPNRPFKRDSIKSVSKKCYPIMAPIVYDGYLVTGFRDSEDNIWKIYPLGLLNASCFRSLKDADSTLALFYFNYLKKSEALVRINDPNYGSKVVKKEKDDWKGHGKTFIYTKQFGTNLQDSNFWTKNIIWQKGANIEGYYNFQLKGNITKTIQDFELKLPQINYPDSILKLYR